MRRAGEAHARSNAAAEDAQVRRWSWLVWRALRSLHVPPGLRDDMFQEGCIGLLRAIRSHDARLGTFSAWAKTKVRGALLDAMRREDHLTRRERETVPENLHRPLPSRLDATTVTRDGKGPLLRDIVPAASPELDMQLDVREAVESIAHPRQRCALRLVFTETGCAGTRREVAGHMGLSPSMVGELVRRGTLRLRERLMAYAG